MQISWDSWAVPTITGTDDLDVTYGIGYAQAVAHAGQVLELYGMARGTAAADWGPAFVDEDTFTVEFGLHDVTETWFAAQAPGTMARVAAFCDGFNAACAEDETRGSARREVLPVTPYDVVAHTVRTLTRFNQIDPKELAFSPEAFYGVTRPGSNAWAVAGSKSSTGNAMVMINPHLSYLLNYHRFVELRTVSPGRDFHGVTLIGFPWQSMGYSEHIGWGHTVNPIRNLAVYALDIADGTYLYDGERRPLDVREQKIAVLGQEPVVVQARRTVHGPVVTAPDGTDVAIRISGVLDHPATDCLEAWWQFSFATTVEELVETQDRLNLPMFNIVAADSAGSIAAVFCGTPWKRTQGTLDDSQRRLPGDDPSWLFDEVHPASAMPRVINPESGWVQNCNETPWYFTAPLLDEADFVPHVAPPVDQIIDIRHAVSHQWLTQHETVSPDQLLALKFSNRAVLADICLEQLCDAAAGEEDLQHAVEVLRAWDRHSHADSSGFLLFWLWASLSAPQLAERTLFAPYELGQLPTALADPAAAVTVLRAAAGMLSAFGISLDSSLGQLATFGVDDDGNPVPASGGVQIVGALKSLEFLPTPTGPLVMLGDTWVSRVELRPGGAPVVDSLLVYPNTTEPGAPASRSQYPLWAADRLRPRED